MIRCLLAFILLLPQGKQIPPAGVPVPPADKAELEAGIQQLGAELEGLRKGKGDLYADVEIFYKSAHDALLHNEFLNAKDIPVAKEHLKIGLQRAKELKDGKPGWATSTGLIPRGYVSKIDGSVQPYGLVVPASYKSDKKHRLDFWLHGRDENLTELHFVQSRLKSAGEFTPAETIVCHLYGRFCNASKFAGEVDLFEALESIKKRYSIDENRISIRGFSMGGASSWHLGAHHAGLWACVAPGAGFAETPVYSNIYKDANNKPTPWQETLWHMYNATDYAVNFSNTGLVAYSGEIDPQKAAADTMAKSLKEEGLEMIHIIGPKTAHKYEPEAKKEVSKRVDEFATKGRDPNPMKVRFTTWTLRYNEMRWVTVDGLEKHWERARVDAHQESGKATVTTKNVSALTLTLPGLSKVVIDGQDLAAAPHYRKVDGKWAAGVVEGLAKRHGLQGPIDDAFMDSFVMVTPTGKPLNEKVGAWAASEQERAITMWRRFFRGDARVIKDDAVSDADIANSNLVLWGDPSSNKVLAKIADKLPIKWSSTEIAVGSQKHAADSHAAVLCYPNPLNPKKYVVLNSGYTFMDQSPMSNARHVSMLPDWAVTDVSTKKVVAADFFGEKWELK